MMNYKLYLAFLFGSLVISIGIQMLFPFPYGLILSIGFFVAMPYIARKLIIKNGSLGRFGMEEVKMEKVCTVCGNKSKGRECSRCGSHQFRMK